MNIPVKTLNRNKKCLEAKSKNIYFTAKKFVDFPDCFQKFEKYTKNLRFQPIIFRKTIDK
jgi:hypothetical protein